METGTFHPDRYHITVCLLLLFCKLHNWSAWSFFITALWPVLIAPTHGGMAKLSWPRWLINFEINFLHQELNPDTVTHPSTNRARRRVTSLIWPTSLPTTPNRHRCQLCSAYSLVSCTDRIISSASAYKPRKWLLITAWQRILTNRSGTIDKNVGCLPADCEWDRLPLSLIHIWRCRRIERCRSRWSPYH